MALPELRGLRGKTSGTRILPARVSRWAISQWPSIDFTGARVFLQSRSVVWLLRRASATSRMYAAVGSAQCPRGPDQVGGVGDARAVADTQGVLQFQIHFVGCRASRARRLLIILTQLPSQHQESGQSEEASRRSEGKEGNQG